MAKKGSRGNVGFNVGVGIMILVLLIGVFIVGFMKNDVEVFPTFQDVSGKIETQVGDYKLDKQAYLGDPNAPVKVVEFIDYKCPYCAMWSKDNFPTFKKDYIDTGKVQLYVVNFTFLGPDSIKAAMVGEILWNQSQQAFWEYHEALYANQGNEKGTWATEQFLLSIIKENVPHGDVAAVKTSLKELEGLFEVKEDFKVTAANGVSSVPTFIVDGQKYVNPDLKQIAQVVDSAFARTVM